MTSVVCQGRLPKSTDALIQIAIGRSSDTVPPRHSADLCRVLRWHDASGSEHAQRRHRPYTEDCRLRSQEKLQRSPSKSECLTRFTSSALYACPFATDRVSTTQQSSLGLLASHDLHSARGHHVSAWRAQALPSAVLIHSGS